MCPDLLLPSTIAYTNLSNVFTEPQTISKDTPTLATLYRPVNTNNSLVQLNFDFNDSVPGQQNYGQIEYEIDANTNGAERSWAAIKTMHNGTLHKHIIVSPTGDVYLGEPTTSVGISSAGLTAIRTFTFPDVSSDVAVEGFANIFTEPQKIQKNTGELLTLDRPSNVVSDAIAITYVARDAANNPEYYGQMNVRIADATNGSEDSQYEFSLMNAGTLTRTLALLSDGTALFGANQRLLLTETGLTTVRAYNFPDADCTLAGRNISNTWTAAQEFRDNVIQITNPAISSSYRIRTSAIAANRDLTLPLLTANDTLAVLGLAQTFTEAQNIEKDVNIQLSCYRPFTTTFSQWGLGFDANDSGANRTTYARFGGEIADATNGSEDGAFVIDVIKNGTITNMMYVDATGFYCGQTGSNNVVFKNDGLTSDRFFKFPDIATIGGESTHPLKVQTHDYYEAEDEFNTSSISTTNTSNSIGSLGWGITHSTGGTPTVVAGVTSHPGIIQIITGATSGNNERLHLTDAAATAFCDPTDIERYAWIVRIPTITSIIVRIGLMQDVSAANGGTAGAFFQFSSAADADSWSTITRQASTSTTNTSGGANAVANNWMLLEAVRLSGGNWEFYINNTLAFTHSANLPTTACNIGCHVETATSSARSLDVDFFKIRTKKLGQRWT